jgi:integral membrane sensor domain MASE1
VAGENLGSIAKGAKEAKGAMLSFAFFAAFAFFAILPEKARYLHEFTGQKSYLIIYVRLAAQLTN